MSFVQSEDPQLSQGLIYACAMVASSFAIDMIRNQHGVLQGNSHTNIYATLSAAIYKKVTDVQF